MKKHFNILVLTLGIIPLVYLYYSWNTLPEKVAIHFNLYGKPDRYGDKSELLILVMVLSLMSVGLYFLLANIYKIDPKKNAAENKDRLQRLGLVISLFISALSCFIIYHSTTESLQIGTRYIFTGIGILFCFIGNYMYNIKPNYFAGIRVPWTLNNKENWRKTHLLAGKLWFAGGIFIAILCLLLPETISIIAFFSIAIILVVIPIVYSYRLYKTLNKTFD